MAGNAGCLQIIGKAWRTGKHRPLLAELAGVLAPLKAKIRQYPDQVFCPAEPAVGRPQAGPARW